MRHTMKITRISLIASTLFALSAVAEEAKERPLGDNLPQMLELLDQQHPEIQAMRQESQAASARVTPAGSLPDPMLRVEWQDIERTNPTLAPNKVGATKYTLSQGIPWWGKRDLQRSVAASEADKSHAQIDVSRSELRARLKMAYGEFFYVHRATTVNAELLGVAERMEQLARARYSAGLAPQQDIIKAQLEITTLRSERLSLGSETRQIEARLNSLLTRPTNAQLVPPKSLPVHPLPSTAELETRVWNRNPQIRLQSAQIESAKANRQLIDKNRYPDFSLGIAPIQMGSRFDRFEVMLEMNLPIRWDVRSAQRDEALAMQSAAESKKNAAELQIRSELAEARTGFELAAAQQDLLNTTLLPQAELTYRSAIAAYETGKVDFATVLDAIRQIRQLRLDLAKNQKEQLARQAELERLIGEDL